MQNTGINSCNHYSCEEINRSGGGTWGVMQPSLRTGGDNAATIGQAVSLKAVTLHQLHSPANDSHYATNAPPPHSRISTSSGDKLQSNFEQHGSPKDPPHHESVVNLINLRGSSKNISSSVQMIIHPRAPHSFATIHFRPGYGPSWPPWQLSRRFCVPSFAAMATLRALPSISALLNRPHNSLPQNSGRRLSLGRLSKHVKLSSTRASADPKRWIQGLSDEGRAREEFGIGSCSGDKNPGGVKVVDMVSDLVGECLGSGNGSLEKFVKENARELAIWSLVFALVCLPDEHALALGPGGPVMEEFWDNVRRYGFYFFTVVSGGLYSLAKPLLDLLKDPSTQILVLIAVIGSFYLVYLTVSTMLGLNDFVYQYAQ